MHALILGCGGGFPDTTEGILAILFYLVSRLPLVVKLIPVYLLVLLVGSVKFGKVFSKPCTQRARTVAR